MADTGAPWNIPYIEPTDLVRNYPVANELMADAIAAGLTAAGNPGIGSNVVNTVKTDSFSSSSAAYTTITGLTATITPTSVASKILIVVYVNTNRGNVANLRPFIRIAGGNAADFVGDAAGSRTQAAASMFSDQTYLDHATIVILDSPATAAAVTYEVQIRRGSTSGAVIVNQSNTDGGDSAVTPSSITLIEVAA